MNRRSQSLADPKQNFALALRAVKQNFLAARNVLAELIPLGRFPLGTPSRRENGISANFQSRHGRNQRSSITSRRIPITRARWRSRAPQGASDLPRGNSLGPGPDAAAHRQVAVSPVRCAAEPESGDGSRPSDLTRRGEATSQRGADHEYVGASLRRVRSCTIASSARSSSVAGARKCCSFRTSASIGIPTRLAFPDT